MVINFSIHDFFISLVDIKSIATAAVKSKGKPECEKIHRSLGGSVCSGAVVR